MPDFDFDDFMRKVNEVDLDTKRQVLIDEVSDVMDRTMLEVAPRMWAVMQEVCNQDPHSTIHLNAVMNSAIFSLLAWCAAVTPDGETNGRSNDEMLREKINANLEAAIKGRSQSTRTEIAQLASNVGRLKLSQDVAADLGKVLMHNSTVLQAVAKEIKRGGGAA